MPRGWANVAVATSIVSIFQGQRFRTKNEGLGIYPIQRRSSSSSSSSTQWKWANMHRARQVNSSVRIATCCWSSPLVKQKKPPKPICFFAKQKVCPKNHHHVMFEILLARSRVKSSGSLCSASIAIYLFDGVTQIRQFSWIKKHLKEPFGGEQLVCSRKKKVPGGNKFISTEQLFLPNTRWPRKEKSWNDWKKEMEWWPSMFTMKQNIILS